MEPNQPGRDEWNDSMRASSGLLLLLGACAFTSAFSGRATDPIVNAIASDLVAPVTVVAMLSSAFTLPYSLSQPFLGPLGDVVGKTRVLKACMALLTLALVGCSAAAVLGELFAARIVAGIAAGGMIPIALAMVGDRYEPATRQVAIGRLLGGALIGQLAGVTASGVLADLVGWRGSLWATAIAAGITCGALFAWLPDEDTRSGTLRPLEMFQRYGLVFANPRSYVCYAAVFCEAIAVYGVQPFVPEILRQRGIAGTTKAGLVIAGLGVGGILFTLLVGQIVSRLGSFLMMVWGGILAGAGLVILAFAGDWPIKMAAFVVIGFGFFMMHNALQGRAVELAPAARGSAVSLHAFSFFIGQAAAPLLFGLLMPGLGATLILILDGALMVGTGLAAANLLRRIDQREGLV